MHNLVINPGVGKFKISIKSKYYIDKTELIFTLNDIINTDDRFICVSCPKGFGKTSIVNMLTAYYSYAESKTTIFDDKKIKEKYIDLAEMENLNEFNVIKLSMSDFFKNCSIEKGIAKVNSIITEEIKDFVNILDFIFKDDIQLLINKLYRETNRQIIIIIDDWDFVLQNEKIDRESRKIYLQFLDSFITDDESIALVYMTGLIPIEWYKIVPELSLLTDFSMTYPKWMSKYIGFSDEEINYLCKKLLNTNLIDNKQEIINKKRTSNDESYQIIDGKEIFDNEKLNHKNEINYENLKEWYSGYHLIDNSKNKEYNIFSPNSVIRSMREGFLKNFQEKKYPEFYELLKENFEILRDIIPLLINFKEIKMDSLMYQNNLEVFNKRKNILILLVHLGYLSSNNITNKLFIPNEETRRLFQNYIKSSKWDLTFENKRMCIFNPGQTNFMETINTDFYVDKTELIFYLNKLVNTNKRYLCVSRPRRFGKTVTADMLSAYYSYTESNITVFNGKNISKMENWNIYLGKFNVIKLNMMKFFSEKNVNEGIKAVKQAIVNEVKDKIPDFNSNGDSSILDIIIEIRKKTGRKILIIIDEWDFIIRDKIMKNNKEAHYKYLKFLSFFIKDEKENIALAYLTGILPMKKYKINSSLGEIDEFSMTSSGWMSKYIGFTDEEVKELCRIYLDDEKTDNLHDESNKDEVINEIEIEKEKMDNNELFEYPKVNYTNLKIWYDGYFLIDEKNKTSYEVYSPFSIVNALDKKIIKNYWNHSETYLLLYDYINMNFDGLKEDVVILMNSYKVSIDTEKYQNDMTTFESKDDILTMLVHLGYLSYNSKKKEVSIPNKEIMKEFENSTKSNVWSVSMKKLRQSQALIEATLRCDNEMVAQYIEDAHDDGANKTYNSEAALSYAIQLAYYKAVDYYYKFVEFDSGKGYADILYIPFNKINKYYLPLLIELKYNKEAEAGITQIKKRNYPERLKDYYGTIILVCITYNKNVKPNSVEYKKHECIIEKYQILKNENNK